MECPKCQAENPETRRFCNECGAKLLEKAVLLFTLSISNLHIHTVAEHPMFQLLFGRKEYGMD